MHLYWRMVDREATWCCRDLSIELFGLFCSLLRSLMSVTSSSLMAMMFFLRRHCFFLTDLRPLFSSRALSCCFSWCLLMSCFICRLIALQISVYSICCACVPPLFICRRFAGSLSGVAGLFLPTVSNAASMMVVVILLLSASMSLSDEVPRASNLLSRCSSNCADFAESI